MTDTTDELSYAERFIRAVEECRSAAAQCRDAIDRAEALKSTLHTITRLRVRDPDDFEPRRPYLLTEPGVPSPSIALEALNQLRFALHGQASIWDAEAEYYAEASPSNDDDTEETA